MKSTDPLSDHQERNKVHVTNKKKKNTKKAKYSKKLIPLLTVSAAVGIIALYLRAHSQDFTSFSSGNTEANNTRAKNALSSSPSVSLQGSSGTVLSCLQGVSAENIGSFYAASRLDRPLRLYAPDQKFLPTVRPDKVQAAVDEVFLKNSNRNPGVWFYDGDGQYDYNLLNIDDARVLKHLIVRSQNRQDKKEINILDVGCSQGGWGIHALEILKEDAKKYNKRVNIFSVTGGKECDEKKFTDGMVTLHQFNQFKIENIDEELIEKDFDLRNKVDLIVSHWTLRHLVDPFGTLKRMYSLLSPYHGALLSNGFLFSLECLSKVQSYPYGNWDCKNFDLRSQSNTISLFRFYRVGRDLGHFLLVRPNAKQLMLPIEYTGEVREIGDLWQCVGETVTVFRKTVSDAQVMTEPYMLGEDGHYCDESNTIRSKELYEYLKSHDLFL